MLKDQRDLVAVLNAHGVKYLVVGGHAVGIHAEPRGTKDLGIFIKADLENSRAVFSGLVEYGVPVVGMSPDDFKDNPTWVFQIGVPPVRIDILQGIADVTFDEAWDQRVDGVLEGNVPAHIISRDHLIKNKLAVGRLQDLADIEKIREAALLDQEPREN
jgi:hypothetical protein